MDFMQAIAQYFSEDVGFWLLVVAGAASALLFFVELMIKIGEWKKIHATINPQIPQKIANRNVALLLVGFLLFLMTGVAALASNRYLKAKTEQLEDNNFKLNEEIAIQIAQSQDLRQEIESMQLAFTNEYPENEVFPVNEVEEIPRIVSEVSIQFDNFSETRPVATSPEDSDCKEEYENLVDYYINKTDEIRLYSYSRNDEMCWIYSGIFINDRFQSLSEEKITLFKSAWSGCPLVADLPDFVDDEVRG